MDKVLNVVDEFPLLVTSEPYRPDETRIIRLEYGQVKKVFILEEPLKEKSMVEENLRVLQRKKYLRMNRNF